MHWKTALLVSLATTIARVHANACSHASITPDSKGFAGFENVLTSWEEEEFGEPKPAEMGPAATLLECTDRCWDKPDCKGVVYKENDGSQACKLYFTGNPTNLRVPEAGQGFMAFAWKQPDTCENYDVKKLIVTSSADSNPSWPCCSIWMGHK